MCAVRIKKNVTHAKQQIQSLLRSTSTSVKCIWIIVIISYFLSFLDEVANAMSATPRNFIPPFSRIWSSFTFCFIETHFWNVLIDIIMIGFSSKVIEPLWGPSEIILFFTVVNLGVVVSSSVFYLFVYVCMSDPTLLFHVKIRGLCGYIAGVTVAVKQIMPDILILKSPIGRTTNRNLPFLTFILSLLLWLIGISDSSVVVMIVNGIFTSWVYLRFYQRHSSGGIGDMSDSFSFASLFPSVVQPPISIVASFVYDCLVKLKICKRRSITYEAVGELSEVTVNVPVLHSQDQERRKQKALRALSEHLNKTDRPRVVGTVTPQKSVNRFPKENVVSPVNDVSGCIINETVSISTVSTVSEQKGASSFDV